MAPQNYITNHYVTQAGNGIGFYAGLSHQKGAGVGSWLAGLFRTILPVLKSGATAVGREAVRAGSHVLADVAAGQNIRGSAKKHIEEAGENLSNALKRKAGTAMSGGSAIKRRKPARQAHSVSKTRRRKTSSSPDYFT